MLARISGEVRLELDTVKTKERKLRESKRYNFAMLGKNIERNERLKHNVESGVNVGKEKDNGKEA